MGSSRADLIRVGCAAMALVLCSCVPTYRVAPLPEPVAVQGNAADEVEPVAVGDVVEVRLRDGTTLGGKVVALDAAGLALQVRQQDMATVRVARADIVSVERFEPGRVVRNVLVVAAIVIGVVMLLMAGVPPGPTSY